MRDHHHHRAGDADQAQARNAEEHEAHVRDTRIAEQQVEVFLSHGDEAAVENVAKAEQRQNVQPRFRAVRHQR